jgi:uncharacterized Zn-binding protein involved in type VI secretion
MPPAARTTDMHVCPMVTVLVPHVGGPILPPCEPTVLIGFLPAARITDMLTCVGPPDVIVMGSPTVLIGGLMAARIGDPTAHGGVIVLGCFTVMIGEAGVPAPSAPSTPSALPVPSVASTTPASPSSSAPNPASVPPAPADSSAPGPPLTPEQYEQNLINAAKAEGDGPFQQSARKAVAAKFYSANCPSMSPADIRSHLRCIDYSKPVELVTVPPPDQLLRWGKPGSKGQYYTDDPKAKPTDLGVPDTQQTLKREALHPGGPMNCLKSTAAPVRADWVDPPVETKGGKTQYFIPKEKQVWKTSGN